MWATDAQGLSFIETDGCIYRCGQTTEGLAPTRIANEIILLYEMGMSRAITRRGYNLGALNLLQRGVDWRQPANAEGCFRATRTCYYNDYTYGPPDLMFTKLSAVEFDARASTYGVLGPMYNATWRASREFSQRYGFSPALAGDPATAEKTNPGRQQAWPRDSRTKQISAPLATPRSAEPKRVNEQR